MTKVDPLGHVVYSTLIGGTSNVFMNPGSLVVDHAGEAILSASSDPGLLSRCYHARVTLFTGTTPNFILKLDSTGRKVLAAIRGMGGLLALDSPRQRLRRGTEEASTIPITPGAFQSTAPELPLCGGTIGAPGLPRPVRDQTGCQSQPDRLLHLPYRYLWRRPGLPRSGRPGKRLAGRNDELAYVPTTSDAFEPNYVANAPPDFNQAFPPPPTTGYVTQLNSTGTALLYSTFFGGTQSDTITFAALTPDGIYLSGQAGSSDLPALEGVPSPCLPETFETRLSLDGSSITATRIVPGQVLAYNPSTRKLLAWTGSDLLSFDPPPRPTTSPASWMRPTGNPLLRSSPASCSPSSDRTSPRKRSASFRAAIQPLLPGLV